MATDSKITILENARRHAVQINDISASANTYQTSGYMKTKELINDSKGVKSIAIFSNEYVPEGSNGEINYVLTINGIDYEIVPINSNKNGTKIIKAACETYTDNYIVYVNDMITSAILTIKIGKASRDIAPYVSNIKVLVGEPDV